MKIISSDLKKFDHRENRNINSLSDSIILRNDTLIVADYDSYIVYSPFTKIITRVSEFPNEGTILENILKQKGFFKSVPNTTRQYTDWDGFTSFTLLLTRKCNLRCIYCYASPSMSGPSIPDNLAIDAVNWFVQQNQGPKIRITFHGGGEPTLERRLIKKVVNQV
ncbi:MAG: hypothetical protein PHY52_02655, partial [Candidatus Pacebacteria bacterium]|nr:hypothetical protein [Candidatus Paceibacterota bacterium]